MIYHASLGSLTGFRGRFVGLIMFRPYGKDPLAHQRYFSLMERVMLQYSGRPHWAKTFDISGRRLGALYPQWDRFWRVREEVDPGRLFWNEWCERTLREGEGESGGGAPVPVSRL